MRSPGVQGLGLDVGAKRAAGGGGGGGGVNPNLLTWTEQFQNAVWVKGLPAVVVPNAGTDPLGGSTADSVVLGDSGTVLQVSTTAATSGSHSEGFTASATWTRISTTATLNSGVYTFSVWVKDPLDSGLSTFLQLDTAGGFVRCLLIDLGDASSFLAWGAKLESGPTPTGDASNYGMRTT